MQNNQAIPNEIPDFVDERDVFGLINTKRIKDKKTLNSILKDEKSNIHFKYASVISRLLAFSIDVLILLCIFPLLKILNETFFPMNPMKDQKSIIIILVIWVIYYALFESSLNQGTIGKMIMNIRVVDINGKKLQFSNALFRGIFEIISLFPFGIGIWGMIGNKNKKGWLDKLFNCYVIK
jgi:uncharacterized RDD family membrane protein YckC